MKKKKALPTRKQKTIRRCLLAAGVMILVLLLRLAFMIHTPTQALRMAEHYTNAGKTEVIAQKRYGNVTFYLSENDTIFMVTAFQPQLGLQQVNWGHPEIALDRTQENVPALAGTSSLFDSRTGQYWTFISGVVNMEEAVSVRACTDTDHYLDVMDGEIFESERGIRYFWFWQDAPLEETDGMVTVSKDLSKDLSHYTQVLLLDENGLVLDIVDLDHTDW